MPAGLNRWPAASLRLGRGTERLLEPPRNCGMKSEGLHGRKGGIDNLDIQARKKSKGGSALRRRCPAQKTTFITSAPRQKNQSAKPQLFANALRTTRSIFVPLRVCSQHDDFA